MIYSNCLTTLFYRYIHWWLQHNFLKVKKHNKQKGDKILRKSCENCYFTK